jgi:multidrug resistance efflux pump
LVKLGQEVLVKVDAFPDKSFRGQVENIGRATASTFSLLPASNSGGNFTKVTQVIPVKIHLFDTGSAGLMVGMNAAIRISLASVR